MTNDPLGPDQIKAYMWSTLKGNFASHPELQAFRDKGVTFEYDYFKQDGTPITQVVVTPSDLK